MSGGRNHEEAEAYLMPRRLAPTQLGIGVNWAPDIKNNNDLSCFLICYPSLQPVEMSRLVLIDEPIPSVSVRVKVCIYTTHYKV